MILGQAPPALPRSSYTHDNRTIASIPAQAQDDTVGSPPLQGSVVLVVEDSFLLAVNVAEALQEAGAVVLGPCCNVSSTLAVLEQDRPSLAVLDVSLGADTSFDIGRKLKSWGVPILFTTGHDDTVVPPDLCDARFLLKPATSAQMIGLLVEARR